MTIGTYVRSKARGVVAEALVEAAGSFPSLSPSSQLPVRALEPRDARLAVAIYRTVLQRWITLEYLLDLFLSKPLRLLEPRLRSVLLSASAQILFFNRLPVHAVVNESVEIAKRLVRPGASSLVNAVLRRFYDQTQPTFSHDLWKPARDRLPSENGSVILCNELLPDPAVFIDHMHVATSYPKVLIRRWIQFFGKDQVAVICRHGLQTPPIIAAMESGVPVGSMGVDARLLRSHAISGFIVWRGGRDQLAKFLAQNPARRIQDPASASPVQATSHLCPKRCLDYCAGRGTKTRQLTSLHPNMHVIATDVSVERFADLQKAFAGHSAVTVVEPDAARRVCSAESVDLLVLDVPCTNTAVLARRPEARYRFSTDTLRSLVQLQRRIVKLAVPLLRPGGHLLYSTCSLEKQENHDQVDWIIQCYSAELVNQQHTLPSGIGDAYHDGSYHALLKM